MPIGIGHHIDVDARLERERGGLRQIRGDTVLDQFANGVVITHNNAVESEPVAQRKPEPPSGDPNKTEPPKPGRQAAQKPTPKNEPKNENKDKPKDKDK